jgi:hypothetical protein
MSAKEIIEQLPKLSAAERLAIQRKLAEIASQSSGVLLPERGINEYQAAGLRSRLKTFAEDWERPEACIYDEDPAR